MQQKAQKNFTCRDIMSFSYFLLVGPVIIPLANRRTFVVMATKACIKGCIYRILIMLNANYYTAGSFYYDFCVQVKTNTPEYSVKSTWK